MKYSLDWLLNIRKNELSSIEVELNSVNSAISDNLENQNNNNIAISKFQNQIYSCGKTWLIASLIRSVENLELSNIKLQDDLNYLIKDKEMILNRYNSKHIEIKLLEKSKSKFLASEQIRKNKKEQADLNELSLIIRKDE